MPLQFNRLRNPYEIRKARVLVTVSHVLPSNLSSTGRTCSSSTNTNNLKSWERGARLVKNTQIENTYLEHIRASHDPSLHVKTIEDELKGTIGKALGKQGEKVRSYLQAMEQERQRYELLLGDHPTTDQKVIATAQKHNALRKDCLHARWELMVHRQAVGFVVGNHKYVIETFPIGDPLPIADEGSSSSSSSSSNRNTSE